jgi:hypothetical protein
MARYKETKERYQQMVNAITRNIEGVFMHGGKMGGAGQFGEGHYMADGGVTPLSGLIISFPDGRERNANKIINIITDYVDNNYEDYGDEIYVRVMDNQRGEVTEYDLQQIAKDVRSLNLGVTVESYAKGGQFAKGGVIYKNWDMQNGEVTYKGKFVTRYHYDNSVDAFFLDIVKGGRGYAIGFTEKTHAYDYLNEHKNLWKFAEGGEMADGGMMNKYDVIYNSYDQETGDMIADNESIYVMANSIAEAKNKAMTMLEEGSQDEDFTIVRVNSMMAKGGHMATGGLTNIKGTTEPKAYPEAEPNTNVVV